MVIIIYIIGSTFLAKPVSSSACTIKPEIVAFPRGAETVMYNHVKLHKTQVKSHRIQ